MKDLCQQLRGRADTLEASYTVNAVAHDAHVQAVENQVLNPCPQNAHAQITTGTAWDRTQEMVIRHAQHLIGTLSLVLVTVPPTTYPALWQQTEILRGAFNEEVTACNRYLNCSGGSTAARETWQAARDEIVKQAQPLIALVRGMDTAEGPVSTEVGV